MRKGDAQNQLEGVISSLEDGFDTLDKGHYLHKEIHEVFEDVADKNAYFQEELQEFLNESSELLGNNEGILSEDDFEMLSRFAERAKDALDAYDSGLDNAAENDPYEHVADIDFDAESVRTLISDVLQEAAGEMLGEDEVYLEMD